MSSKSIVIDASIACASGPPESKKPMSTMCRSFLLSVLNICHKIVLTSDIRKEWEKHKSTFTRKWLKSMYARKKSVSLQDDVLMRISKASLANISQCSNAEAIMKDILLIEAALSSDKIIASADGRMRNILKENKDKIPELKGIIWVDPTKEEENITEWLEKGARVEKKRFLV